MSTEEEFRGYLLLLGLVVFIGVFWFTKFPLRFSKRRGHPKKDRKPIMPPRLLKTVADSEPPETLVVYLRAANGEPFPGMQILQAARKVGLETHGKQRGSFRFVESGQEEKKAEFLVASMFEPGEFEWARMEEYRTGGLIFIALLQPDSDLQAVRKCMLDCAVLMAEQLGGEVLDGKTKMFSPGSGETRQREQER